MVKGIIKSWASALTGTTLYDEDDPAADELGDREEFEVDQLFAFSKVTGRIGDAEEVEGTYHIIAKSLTQPEIKIPCKPSWTLEKVKEEICRSFKVPVDELRVIFAGSQLHCGVGILKDFDIPSGSTIHVVRKAQGRGTQANIITNTFLAPSLDYDFRKRDDLHEQVLYRGGLLYHRPYGFNRIAINVSNKYPEMTWLGSGGLRTGSSEGEWPVAYHGTATHQGITIGEEGFFQSVGKRYRFGVGIYVTPSPKIAEKFAAEFEHNGAKYKAILQSRVNPDNLIRIPVKPTAPDYRNEGETAEFWALKDKDSVRPYGICFKKVSH